MNVSTRSCNPRRRQTPCQDLDSNSVGHVAVKTIQSLSTVVGDTEHVPLSHYTGFGDFVPGRSEPQNRLQVHSAMNDANMETFTLFSLPSRLPHPHSQGPIHSTMISRPMVDLIPDRVPSQRGHDSSTGSPRLEEITRI
ncbi:hypothetical protein J1614_004849 [Plenodomus biglobosus]|nr:hypothetical protein J1614_004849 [Plenodomus biglobosus]